MKSPEGKPVAGRSFIQTKDVSEGGVSCGLAEQTEIRL